MHTLLVVLSLFAHRYDAFGGFVNDVVNWWDRVFSETYRFEIDTVIMYPNEWSHTHRYNDFIVGSGTECTLYVMHGDNPVVTVSGVDEPVWSETRESVQLTRFEFPSWYDVSVNYYTLIWTSCEDPVLIDFVRLVAPDGTIQDGVDHYGYHHVGCMSTNMEAWHDIYNAPNQATWIERWGGHWGFGIACYQTSLYGPGDEEGEMQNYGNWDNYAYYTQRVIMGRDDRRELQEQISELQEQISDLPSTEDVRACELDSTKESAECALMVEQILNFQKALFEQMKNDPDYQTHLQEAEGETTTTEQESLEETSSALRRLLP